MKYYKITNTWENTEEVKLYYEIAKNNGFNVKNLISDDYDRSKFEIELNSLEDVIKLSKLVKADIIIITNNINGETSLEIYDGYRE